MKTWELVVAWLIVVASVVAATLTVGWVHSVANNPKHKTTYEINEQRDRMEEKLDQLIELGEKWQ